MAYANWPCSICGKLISGYGATVCRDHSPVAQDIERFAKFAPDKRAEMPEGYSAPLDFKPVRTLIRERKSNL